MAGTLKSSARISETFCNTLVRAIIVVASALTYCGLFQSAYYLKAAQMNVQHCLIREFMLYEFRLDHNVVYRENNPYV